MKRMIVACLLVLLLLSATVQAEDAKRFVCQDEYTLFLNADGTGYTGQCTLCDEMIAVALVDELVIGTADAAGCTHAYQCTGEPLRLAWASAEYPVLYNGNHTHNTWYALNCRLCGHEARGFTVGEEMYAHVWMQVTEAHAYGEDKHAEVYRCEVCGEYVVTLQKCFMMPGKYACQYEWRMYYSDGAFQKDDE